MMNLLILILQQMFLRTYHKALCQIKVKQTLTYVFRAGDHVTFVYGNIKCICYFFNISFKLLLIYNYRPCSRKTNSDSSGIKLSNIDLVFFYLCSHKLVTHIFNKTIPH